MILCSFLLVILLFSSACTIKGTSPGYVSPPAAPPAVPAAAQAPVPAAIPTPAPAPSPHPASAVVSPNAPLNASLNATPPVQNATVYPPFVEYRGFGFYRRGGVWQTQTLTNGKNVTLDFHYLPQEVEAVPVLGNVKDILYNSELFVTFDPTEEEFKYVSLAAFDISNTLGTVYNIKPIASCTSDDPAACQTRPEKTCDDANVIYIKQSPVAMVLQRNACVQVQGMDEDLLKAMTKLLMVWYGILPPS